MVARKRSSNQAENGVKESEAEDLPTTIRAMKSWLTLRDIEFDASARKPYFVELVNKIATTEQVRSKRSKARKRPASPKSATSRKGKKQGAKRPRSTSSSKKVRSQRATLTMEVDSSDNNEEQISSSSEPLPSTCTAMREWLSRRNVEFDKRSRKAVLQELVGNTIAVEKQVVNGVKRKCMNASSVAKKKRRTKLSPSSRSHTKKNRRDVTILDVSTDSFDGFSPNTKSVRPRTSRMTSERGKQYTYNRTRPLSSSQSPRSKKTHSFLDPSWFDVSATKNSATTRRLDFPGHTSSPKTPSHSTSPTLQYTPTERLALRTASRIDSCMTSVYRAIRTLFLGFFALLAVLAIVSMAVNPTWMDMSRWWNPEPIYCDTGINSVYDSR